MGVERMTVTAKVEAEIALFIEGISQNWFGPFRISESAAIEGIIRYVRDEIAAGRLDPRTIILQGFNRIHRLEARPEFVRNAPPEPPAASPEAKPQRAVSGGSKRRRIA